jgi:hypothetical protein
VEKEREGENAVLRPRLGACIIKHFTGVMNFVA